MGSDFPCPLLYKEPTVTSSPIPNKNSLAWAAGDTDPLGCPVEFTWYLRRLPTAALLPGASNKQNYDQGGSTLAELLPGAPLSRLGIDWGGAEQ